MVSVNVYDTSKMSVLSACMLLSCTYAVSDGASGKYVILSGRVYLLAESQLPVVVEKARKHINK